MYLNSCQLIQPASAQYNRNWFHQQVQWVVHFKLFPRKHVSFMVPPCIRILNISSFHISSQVCVLILDCRVYALSSVQLYTRITHCCNLVHKEWKSGSHYISTVKIKVHFADVVRSIMITGDNLYFENNLSHVERVIFAHRSCVLHL